MRRVRSAYKTRPWSGDDPRGEQMGIIRGGRLRRLALVMSFGVLTALAIAGATSARVDDGSSGSAPAVRLAETAGIRDVLSRRRASR